MYICICNAVTEKDIERAVENGACRMRDLRNTLGVASDCACCAQSARDCLEASLEKRSCQSWNLASSCGGVFAISMEAS